MTVPEVLDVFNLGFVMGSLTTIVVLWFIALWRSR
jgi:hypothetical protein